MLLRRRRGVTRWRASQASGSPAEIYPVNSLAGRRVQIGSHGATTVSPYNIANESSALPSDVFSNRDSRECLPSFRECAALGEFDDRHDIDRVLRRDRERFAAPD